MAPEGTSSNPGEEPKLIPWPGFLPAPVIQHLGIILAALGVLVIVHQILPFNESLFGWVSKAISIVMFASLFSGSRKREKGRREK